MYWTQEQPKKQLSPEEQALSDARLVKLFIGTVHGVDKASEGRYYFRNGWGLYNLAGDFNSRNGKDIERLAARGPLDQGYREKLERLPGVVRAAFREENGFPYSLDNGAETVVDYLKELMAHPACPVSQQAIPRTHAARALRLAR